MSNAGSKDHLYWILTRVYTTYNPFLFCLLTSAPFCIMESAISAISSMVSSSQELGVSDAMRCNAMSPSSLWEQKK